MSVSPVAPTAELVTIRRSKMAATQLLLGSTITISDADWRQPTGLPGWTRAHLATHISRNADATRRAIVGIQTDGRFHIEPDDDLRDLEVGSRRSPLDLQIDLDTSAGRLNEAFNALTPAEWQLPIGDGLTVADLPTARLNEVVLHHVDLDCGYGFADIDVDVTHRLLEWNVRRRTDLAAGATIQIQSTGGVVAQVGSRSPVTVVSGADANLLGWITGRLPRNAVIGADHLGVGPPR